MSFIWTEPTEIQNKGTRVAAVDVHTEMIRHIFNNVIDASTMLTGSSGYAKAIGEALHTYHKNVLGYYWKNIK